MSENLIADAGICELSAALMSTGTAQEEIDVSMNLVGDEGMGSLSEALEENQTLRRLDLGGNLITNSGACDISRALETNKTLQAIDLMVNPVSDTGATGIALINALGDFNFTVTSLTLSGKDINSFDGISHQIYLLCTRNKHGMNCLRPSRELNSLGRKAQALRNRGIDVEAQCMSSYICPISQTLMSDPVIVADGYTYERSEIERWLTTSNNSPQVNTPLDHRVVISNRVMKSDIYAWVDDRLREYGLPPSLFE